MLGGTMLGVYVPYVHVRSLCTTDDGWNEMRLSVTHCNCLVKNKGKGTASEVIRRE